MHRDRCSENAEVHSGLQYGRNPRSPGARPSLDEKGSADSPFAADPKRRNKTENHQLPPRLRRRAQTRAERVRQNGESERATPSEKVAETSEKRASYRSTDKKRSLDVGAFFFNRLVVGARRIQQLHDQGCSDQRIKMKFESVEQPAQPSGEAGFPLRWR